MYPGRDLVGSLPLRHKHWDLSLHSSVPLAIPATKTLSNKWIGVDFARTMNHTLCHLRSQTISKLH